jgi:APA family basic amino acid/polyamine antiporter
MGLFSVCALACGAMLSGIFVLPGYAASIGGSTVFLAFLVAGLLFLPAALSKAELATALPEAGGDYIFIDRALGPVFSTISGIGTWLLLNLKSAFALVGLGAYLTFVLPVSLEQSMNLAVLVGLGLIIINGLGVKKTSRLQTVLVVLSGLVLLVFVEQGAIRIHREYFVSGPQKGVFDFVSAVAFVFISYAGVTKIASAAGEIKNPDRNIPLGIIVSLAVMVLLYTLVAFVYVGVVPPALYGESAASGYENAPLAQATLVMLGEWGQFVISLVAILALASMANAGLLACSRYPLAMARHDQLPGWLARVHPTLGTPLPSIGLTGLVMIASVIFLPVMKLAKLASGFLLIVFAVLNVCVIIFRESGIEWYRPSFRSPGYPYLHFLGVVLSLVLLPFLGLLTMISALGLGVLGVGWYFLYVRGRVNRSATVTRDFDRNKLDRSLTSPEQDLLNESHRDQLVLIPFFNFEQDDLLAAQERIESALAMFDESYTFKVLHFHEVADSYFLDHESGPEKIDVLLERYVDRLNRGSAQRVLFDSLRTTGSRKFLRQYVAAQRVKYTLLDWTSKPRWSFLIFKSGWWLDDFPSELLMIRNGSSADFDRVDVFTDAFPDNDQFAAVKTGASIADRAGVDLCINLLNYSDGTDASLEGSGFKEYFSSLGRTAPTVEIFGGNQPSGKSDNRDGNALVVLDRQTPDHPFLTSSGNEQTLVRSLPAHNDDNKRQSLFSDLGRHLHSDDVYLGTWKPLSKRALFHEAAASLETDRVPANVIEKNLWQTENRFSTYRGRGLAIPHATVDGSRTRIAFFKLKRPVSFSDEGSITFCVTILGEDGSEVLELVRSMDQVLHNDQFFRRLREADRPNEVLKLFRGSGTAVP